MIQKHAIVIEGRQRVCPALFSFISTSCCTELKKFRNYGKNIFSKQFYGLLRGTEVYYHQWLTPCWSFFLDELRSTLLCSSNNKLLIGEGIHSSPHKNVTKSKENMEYAIEIKLNISFPPKCARIAALHNKFQSLFVRGYARTHIEKELCL